MSKNPEEVLFLSSLSLSDPIHSNQNIGTVSAEAFFYIFQTFCFDLGHGMSIAFDDAVDVCKRGKIKSRLKISMTLAELST